MPNKQPQQQQDPQTNITEEALKGISSSVAKRSGTNIADHIFGKDGLMGKLMNPIFGESRGDKQQEHEEKMAGEHEAYSELEQQQNSLRKMYSDHAMQGGTFDDKMRQDWMSSGLSPQELDGMQMRAKDSKEAVAALQTLKSAGWMDDKTAGLMAMALAHPQLAPLATELLKSQAKLTDAVQQKKLDLAYEPQIKAADVTAMEGPRAVTAGMEAAAKAPYAKVNTGAAAKEEAETRKNEMAVTNAVGQANENVPLVKGKDANPDANVDNVYRANDNAFASPAWTPDSVANDAGFAATVGGKAIAGRGLDDFLNHAVQNGAITEDEAAPVRGAFKVTGRTEAEVNNNFLGIVKGLPPELRKAITRVRDQANEHYKERSKRTTQHGTP
jgi:hypothetical protein